MRRRSVERAWLTQEWFDTVEPNLVRRKNGGWLAISPPGSPLGIGVEAWNVENAKNRFRRELLEWHTLLSAPPSRIVAGGSQ